MQNSRIRKLGSIWQNEGHSPIFYPAKSQLISLIWLSIKIHILHTVCIHILHTVHPVYIAHTVAITFCTKGSTMYWHITGKIILTYEKEA